jgi:hypothetical protein
VSLKIEDDRVTKTNRAAATDSAPLLVSRSLAYALLRLYDIPDPRHPRRIIRGYDRPHALRTARMCAAVAEHLGHPSDRLIEYQIACLLHDVGRAGLDRRLFGRIWSWAKAHGVPTRPREWRAVHPNTPYGRETEAFLKQYGAELEKSGISMDRWAREQIEMRLGYASRLRRRLKSLRPMLKQLGVRWSSWMELVVLYYYYPERLQAAPPWVRELAEVLVACEQFEAYNNRQRGKDYYVRSRERLKDAFAYLEKLRIEGMLSTRVVGGLRELAARGTFDELLRQSRGQKLSAEEQRYLRKLGRGATA